MLRSAMTCTNGCSCWSTDEENSSGFLLTIDARAVHDTVQDFKYPHNRASEACC
jgi:hypothetical protein